MRRRLELASLALMVAALIGCDGSGDGVTDGVGDFSFGFSAVDGDFSILISLQSVEGETLELDTYEMGADDETRIFAGGSVIYDFSGNNTVYDAIEGSDSIVLQTFDEAGASGFFSFTGSTPDDEGQEVSVLGGFDVEF